MNMSASQTFLINTDQKIVSPSLPITINEGDVTAGIGVLIPVTGEQLTTTNGGVLRVKGGVTLVPTGRNIAINVGDVDMSTSMYLIAEGQSIEPLTGNVSINTDQILSISGNSANIRVSSLIFWDPVVPGATNTWTNVNANSGNTWSNVNAATTNTWTKIN
jgi:hypothetical protein